MSRSLQKINDLIRECDALIKSGQGDEVHRRVSRLTLARVPREARRDLANICRRAGLVKEGLHLLYPIVRSEKKREHPAPPREICEYAVLLSRNDSVAEAIELLQRLSLAGTAPPEAPLYLAFCHISNGDHEIAIPLLEEFLRSEIDDYSKLIARVNLSAAYLETAEIERAEELVKEALAAAESAGAARLAGNCLEQLGRCFFFRGDFTKARATLNQAAARLSAGSGFDPLAIEKWRAVMDSQESGSLDALNEYRVQASRDGYWVGVRDADLYRVKAIFDQDLFDRLMIGTPMLAYRARAINRIGALPSDSYLLGDKRATTIFDLETGHLGKASTVAGKKIHQTIAALTRDLYVPQNTGSLFAEIFPEEYFNIETSPGRVRALIFRTNLWLKQNELPAAVEFAKGGYRLSLQGPFGVRLPLARAQAELMTARWESLLASFSETAKFDAPTACERLRWSRSAFHRLSRWAIEQKRLEKVGSGRAVEYQIIQRKSA